MFNNVGDKIKTLGMIIAFFGIVLSVFGGLGLAFMVGFFIGALVLVFGVLVSLIVSFFLYGYGEIINQLEYSNRRSEQLYDLLSSKDGDVNDMHYLYSETPDNE